jgi:hypothetical protein
MTKTAQLAMTWRFRLCDCHAMVDLSIPRKGRRKSVARKRPTLPIFPGPPLDLDALGQNQRRRGRTSTQGIFHDMAIGEIGYGG